MNGKANYEWIKGGNGKIKKKNVNISFEKIVERMKYLSCLEDFIKIKVFGKSWELKESTHSRD